MKGLLVKDLRIMMTMKFSIVFLILFSIVNIIDNNVSFGVGYTLFLAITLAVGTCSYDKLDNGMQHILTLPVSRKLYVVEKYVFVLLASIAGAILAIVEVVVANAFKSNMINLEEQLICIIIMFGISLLAAAVMLPVNIKFDAEKSKIFRLIVIGMIVVVIVLLQYVTEDFMSIVYEITEIVNGIDIDLLKVGGGVIVVVGFVVSMFISIKITEKMEY
ncbi:MAG: ABC-2 transporter permease [Lachnospiraceae bacterium]|nr:ABC-2 transporter permease [Lachnospiraceae bacterium]